MEVLGTEGYKIQFMFRQHGIDMDIWYKSDKTWLTLDMGEEGYESVQNG